MSEKGKIAIKRATKKRRENFEKACEGISWKEKVLIGRFYKNCSVGYEVDHIIPIAKGGLHRLSNLQYLTQKENSKKQARLDWIGENPEIQLSLTRKERNKVRFE